MFRSRYHRRLLLPALLAVGLVASGCLGLPADPEGPGQNVSEQSGTDPREKEAPGARTNAWEVGDAWRYEVSGAHIDRPGLVTIGVVEAGAGSFRLGADHTGVLQSAVTGTQAPWVGKVDADTLAPYVDGRPRDLIGIHREPGETWAVHYAGAEFSFVRSEPLMVDGAPGHRAAGAAEDGRSIVVEFNEEAGWFTKFTMRDEDNRLLIGFQLSQRLQEPPNMLETWEVLTRHRATGFDSRMGFEDFHSDGTADLVLVKVHVRDDAVLKRSASSSSSSGGLVGGLVDRASDLLRLSGTQVHTSSGTGAGVTVLGPGEHRIVDLRGLEPGESVRMYQDQPGPWQLVATTGGPSVEVTVYRIDVVHHIL